MDKLFFKNRGEFFAFTRGMDKTSLRCNCNVMRLAAENEQVQVILCPDCYDKADDQERGE